MGSVEKRIDTGGAGRVRILPASAVLRQGAPHGSERSVKYHTVILSVSEGSRVLPRKVEQCAIAARYAINAGEPTK